MNKIVFVLLGLILILGGVFIGMNLSPETVIQEKIIAADNHLTSSVEIPIVAIDNNGNGAVSNLKVEIRPGTGLVLVNINDVLADILTQQSARIAASVASQYTNVDTNSYDITYTIKANATVVGGPSAGSSMAVATILALENKSAKSGIVLTGSINEDGTLGGASGLTEKAKAAKSINANLFLIPKGSLVSTTNFKEEKSCGFIDGMEYCQIIYKAVESKFGEELNIEVKEVSDIHEALSHYTL